MTDINNAAAPVCIARAKTLEYSIGDKVIIRESPYSSVARGTVGSIDSTLLHYNEKRAYRLFGLQFRPSQLEPLSLKIGDIVETNSDAFKGYAAEKGTQLVITGVGEEGLEETRYFATHYPTKKGILSFFFPRKSVDFVSRIVSGQGGTFAISKPGVDVLTGEAAAPFTTATPEPATELETLRFRNAYWQKKDKATRKALFDGKAEVNSLRADLRLSGAYAAELSVSVDRLSAMNKKQAETIGRAGDMIDGKDILISEVGDRLSKATASISALKARADAQSKTIADKTRQLEEQAAEIKRLNQIAANNAPPWRVTPESYGRLTEENNRLRTSLAGATKDNESLVALINKDVSNTVAIPADRIQHLESHLLKQDEELRIAKADVAKYRHALSAQADESRELRHALTQANKNMEMAQQNIAWLTDLCNTLSKRKTMASSLRAVIESKRWWLSFQAVGWAAIVAIALYSGHAA